MSSKQITEVFPSACDAYYEIFSDKTDSGYKYNQLSPFEFKNILIREAENGVGSKNVLNAGRGNPNFLSTMPRYGFSLLTHICTVISESEFDIAGIGMMPSKKGIYKKFYKLLKHSKGLPEGVFLLDAVEKMRKITGMKKDDFISNLVISCLGCFYPEPSRIQDFAEPVLVEFLEKTVYKPKKPFKDKLKLFLTEGATAAIVYIFDSLKYNGLVVASDTIGIITPIYSPYLEIPILRNYQLSQVCVKTDEDNNWDIPDEEIAKIGDPSMRALFLANPANPSSMSLSEKTVRKIAAIVKAQNPNIIIITDNVYAPFVGEFNSLFNALPRNTIGVYSFSKYFGATGWRLGIIAMHTSNIIDSRLLKESSADVNDRYKMISLHPERIKFIDRLLIDSRQVAEAHTAGLSTPQQTFMCLCGVHEVLDIGLEYNHKLKQLLKTRITSLITPIEYRIDETPLNSNYYIVINITKVANSLMGGTDFGSYLYKHRDPLEFLMKLAKKYGTVLLPALGFAGPFWGVRASIANLTNDDYHHIGQNLRNLIDEYYHDFQKWERKQTRLLDR